MYFVLTISWLLVVTPTMMVCSSIDAFSVFFMMKMKIKKQMMLVYCYIITFTQTRSMGMDVASLMSSSISTCICKRKNEFC